MKPATGLDGIPMDLAIAAKRAHFETTKNTNKLLEPNNVFETMRNAHCKILTAVFVALLCSA